MTTIILGKNRDGIKILPWTNNNGMIIAGVSGSGKSQTASLYLTQYAHNGARIILGDYGAYAGNSDETLTERISHLSRAMLLPPVNSGTDIIRYIEYVQELGNLRKEGKAESFPLIFAIDEFSAFVMSNKPAKKIRKTRTGDRNDYITVEQKAPNYLETLLDSITGLRKYHIRFMLIGQEWAQMGTSGVRAVRSQVSTQIIHKLDNTLAGMFGFTSNDEKRQIMNLGVGQVYFNGMKYQVPLLDDTFIAQTVKRLERQRIITAPLINTQDTIRLSYPIKRCDGRWNNTRCLAYLLDVDYNSLENKRKYG